MATRRRKTATARAQRSGHGGAEARAFTVVVEEINSKINVFGEALGVLRDEVHGLHGQVKAELQELRSGMTSGFQEVNRRLTVVETDLSVVKTDLSLVKTAVVETGREVGQLRRTVDSRAYFATRTIPRALPM